jgi:predicted nicotinamide N-methyase
MVKSTDFEELAAFIRAHTRPSHAPLVPELALYLATEVTPLWQASEAVLAETGLPPPYWAFAWPGGQALARYVLDHPETVRGRRVLDFAAGSGIVGLAALAAGAAEVTASEIDPFAGAALALNAEANAEANGRALRIEAKDFTAAVPAFDIILAGDVCYEKPMAARVESWLRQSAARGILCLIGDPTRAYLPSHGMAARAEYVVPTSLDLEDTRERRTTVWQILPGV